MVYAAKQRAECDIGEFVKQANSPQHLIGTNNSFPDILFSRRMIAAKGIAEHFPT
jgi:hypothetical protein